MLFNTYLNVLHIKSLRPPSCSFRRVLQSSDAEAISMDGESISSNAAAKSLDGEDKSPDGEAKSLDVEGTNPDVEAKSWKFEVWKCKRNPGKLLV